MTAVLRRELWNYFSTPIGYIYLGIFYLFSGFYFFSAVLLNNSTELSYVFSNLFTICLFVIPILTMRLFSEEKRNKTDQAVLTAPVRLSSLVIGKYISAFLMFFLGTLETILFAVIVDNMAMADWAVVWGNLIGIWLLGAALTAIGAFLSSVTENQIIAAVGGMAAGLFLMLLEGAANILPDGRLRKGLILLSFQGHYQHFTQGLLSFEDVIFFISMVFVFLFFTIRHLEAERWK